MLFSTCKSVLLFFLLPLTSPKSKRPLIPLASAASCPAIGAATDCCPGVACAGREVGGAGGPLATPGDGGRNGCRRVFCTGKERGCGGRAFRMTVPRCPPGLHFVRRCGSKGFFQPKARPLPPALWKVLATPYRAAHLLWVIDGWGDSREPKAAPG